MSLYHQLVLRLLLAILLQLKHGRTGLSTDDHNETNATIALTRSSVHRRST